jgi:hypothetical protein
MNIVRLWYFIPRDERFHNFQNQCLVHTQSGRIVTRAAGRPIENPIDAVLFDELNSSMRLCWNLIFNKPIRKR